MGLQCVLFHIRRCPPDVTSPNVEPDPVLERLFIHYRRILEIQRRLKFQGRENRHVTSLDLGHDVRCASALAPSFDPLQAAAAEDRYSVLPEITGARYAAEYGFAPPPTRR